MITKMNSAPEGRLPRIMQTFATAAILLLVPLSALAEDAAPTLDSGDTAWMLHPRPGVVLWWHGAR